MASRINTGTWTNTFGQPPGGTTSGPMVGWDDQIGLAIVIRGAGNIPFIRRMNATTIGTGVDLEPWQQLGTQAINSAPAVTMYASQDVDAFALFSPNNDINLSVCGFPTCFASWSSLGGVGLSSPSATQFTFPGGVNKVMTVGVVGAFDTGLWVNTWNGSTWTGWVTRGGVAASAPTVWYFTVGNNGPWLAVLGTDGNYWTNGSGTAWSNISHP